MPTPTVHISNYDNVYVKIDAPVGILEHFEQLFRFRPDNYQFTPKYKAGLWDGYIKLFNIYSGLIYGGLLKDILATCKKYNYKFTVDKELLSFDNITFDDITAYFQEVKPTDDEGEPLEARDYQTFAIEKSVKFRRLLLESATSSGKSFIIYMILKYLFDHDKIQSALITVPTVSLVNQLKTDFDDYSQANGFDVDDWVHQIYSGQDKWTDKPIVISTWQSIYDLEDEWFSQYDCFIGDEAHGCEAKSLTRIMENLTNAKYRIGMTGSLKDDPASLMRLQGLFGTRVKVINAKEMINRGFASKLDINGIMLEYSPEKCRDLAADRREVAKENKEKKNKGLSTDAGAEYQVEVRHILESRARRKYLRNLTVTRKGNVLVLFQFIEHGEQILEDVKKAVGDTRPVYFIHGKVKGKTREQIRKAVEKSKDAIVVASYGTFSTGVNIKRLHHLIFAFPSKSKIKIIQSIGRILRKAKSKDRAVLWDLCDDMQWKSKMNYAKEQFVERLKIYTNEGHEYKIHKVRLEDERPSDQLEFE